MDKKMTWCTNYLLQVRDECASVLNEQLVRKSSSLERNHVVDQMEKTRLLALMGNSFKPAGILSKWI
jgi:hypothetical protein